MIDHVFFLRHFKTQNNINNYLNGCSLYLPISESKFLICDNSIDTLLCSPALRCRQTINYIQFQGAKPQIIYTEELLERNLGCMEGQLRNEMIHKYPHLFKDSKFIVFSDPPCGESYDNFRIRVMNFWEKCNQIYHGNILICAHNQLLKMLFFTINRELITVDSWSKKTFPYGTIVKIK